MSWNYIAGDNYDLNQLFDIEDAFLALYYSHLKDLRMAESYRKYGLPNWRTEIIRREAGLKIACENLTKVREVIEVVKRENR